MTLSDRLPRSFYAQDARTVAQAALGKILVRRIEDHLLLARIVETEAYVGPHDLACHASKGRTRRTEIMFGPPGFAYVYLVYGMHNMFNLVTGAEGDPQAVLIRAAEPIEVEPAASAPPKEAQPWSTSVDGGPKAWDQVADGHAPNLSGPGRLTRAMCISTSDNGQNLCGDGLFLMPGTQPDRIVASPRIGVDYAGEWSHAPLRFHVEGNPSVSRRPTRGQP